MALRSFVVAVAVIGDRWLLVAPICMPQHCFGKGGLSIKMIQKK